MAAMANEYNFIPGTYRGREVRYKKTILSMTGLRITARFKLLNRAAEYGPKQ